MIDTSTAVLILRSVRHGGLAVTQSLGRLGVPVYVLDSNPHTPSFFSRYCRGKFTWDLDQASQEHSVAFLTAIGRKFERKPIIIPTTDTAAIFLASNADALRDTFLFPNLSARLARSLHSKKEMHYLAKSAGVLTPDVIFPESKQDALNFAQCASFPIMMKIVESRRQLPTGAPNKVIVYGKQELLDNYDLMALPDEPNLLLQEYLAGGEEASWMFNGYFDQDSNCLFGMTGHKIRQNRPYAGVTSLGVCVPNAELYETTSRFMKTVSYQGILDVGYRLDPRDRTYKVFDVNPRIGCTFRLFVSDTGMDVARSLYLNLTGQVISAGNAVPGRKWMVEDLDLASSYRYWREGTLTGAQWLQSFRGVRETAFFAPDDLLATLAMCANGVAELCRRPWKTVAKPFYRSTPPVVGRGERSTAE